MNFARAAAIGTAVLYEGYILYPYGPSAIKNRQRWTFGGVFPADHAAHGGSDPCVMQTECLLRAGAGAVVEIRVRFLHLVRREVGALEDAAELPGDWQRRAERVPALDVDGTRFLAWEEAIEREVAAPALDLDRLLEGMDLPFAFPGARSHDPIRRKNGRIAGVLIRSSDTVQGSLGTAAKRVSDDTFRLTTRITNTTPLPELERSSRAVAQRRAFVSTHTLLGVTGGEFVSLFDPPTDLVAAAAACDNQGTWPVLAGSAGERDLMLSSPIILYDYPQIAPESAGDLFDATEIDEILSLRILTMTEAEKRDMAAVDPRARALLERTEALSPAEFARLHGVLRNPHVVAAALPTLNAGGLGLRVGDRLRLRPRPGADIMDIVLKDKVAVIEAIERDFEDRVHLAVTLLDDPGRDLGLARMPGHRFFFAPNEVELVPAEAAQ